MTTKQLAKLDKIAEVIAKRMKGSTCVCPECSTRRALPVLLKEVRELQAKVISLTTRGDRAIDEVRELDAIVHKSKN